MFDELVPMSLSEGARRAGVEPLELLRLMVESDTVTPRLQLTAAQVENLVRVGGVEYDWWNAVPTDGLTERQIVLVAVGLLAVHAREGKPVRMDNLWRGRPVEQQQRIEEALNLLDEQGTIRIVNAPAGVQIHVDASTVPTLEAIGAGTEDGGLGVLFQG